MSSSNFISFSFLLYTKNYYFDYRSIYDRIYLVCPATPVSLSLFIIIYITPTHLYFVNSEIQCLSVLFWSFAYRVYKKFHTSLIEYIVYWYMGFNYKEHSELFLMYCIHFRALDLISLLNSGNILQLHWHCALELYFRCTIYYVLVLQMNILH